MKAKRTTGLIVVGLALGITSVAVAAGPPSGPLKKCPADAVVSGTVCMDKYEASVWRVADPLGAGKKLVKKIWQGKATTADLTAGATQLGTAGDDYAPCTDNGQNCTNDRGGTPDESNPDVAVLPVVTWLGFRVVERPHLVGNGWEAAPASFHPPGDEKEIGDGFVSRAWMCPGQHGGLGHPVGERTAAGPDRSTADRRASRNARRDAGPPCGD